LNFVTILSSSGGDWGLKKCSKAKFKKREKGFQCGIGLLLRTRSVKIRERCASPKGGRIKAAEQGRKRKRPSSLNRSSNILGPCQAVSSGQKTNNTTKNHTKGGRRTAIPLRDREGTSKDKKPLREGGVTLYGTKALQLREKKSWIVKGLENHL